MSRIIYKIISVVSVTIIELKKSLEEFSRRKRSYWNLYKTYQNIYIWLLYNFYRDIQFVYNVCSGLGMCVLWIPFVLLKHDIWKLFLSVCRIYHFQHIICFIKKLQNYPCRIHSKYQIMMWTEKICRYCGFLGTLTDEILNIFKTNLLYIYFYFQV